MKILFSGYHNPHFITITEYIEKAIPSRGYEIIIFDDRCHVIPGRLRQRIKCLQNFDLRYINKKILHLASEMKPSVALITGGDRVMPESVMAFKELGICTALWTIDAPVFRFSEIAEAARLYDYIFCGGTEAITLLKDSGVTNSHWLPFACDPNYHKPVELTPTENKKYSKDVVFVGSYYPNRWKILKHLNGYRIGIWGPNWHKIGSENLKSYPVESSNLKHFEWLKIYSGAKIVIIIHYQDGKTLCHQASPKVYEALACGSFVLVDRQKDVFSQFTDGEHLVCFNGIHDLREKIDFFLTHPDKRNKIAAQGQKEVLNQHTYIHRIKKLFATIEDKGHNEKIN